MEGQASEGRLLALSAGQGGCRHGGILRSMQAEGGETSRAGPPPGHLQEVLCGCVAWREAGRQKLDE